MQNLILVISIILNVVFIVLFFNRKKKNIQSLSSSTISSIAGNLAKTILKTNYYYEFRKFFDGLPDMLPVPETFFEKTNDRTMTEEEMTKGHEFFSKEEAFGLACKFVQEKKERIIWFIDNGVLCYAFVWHSSNGPNVYVHEYISSDRWSEGNCSVFRK
jgi:hypothetical protein